MFKCGYKLNQIDKVKNLLAVCLNLLFISIAFFQPASVHAQAAIPIPQKRLVISVEGSARLGGLQPDYVISTHDPLLAAFLEGVAHDGARLVSPLAKVRFALKRVGQTIVASPYDDPTYLRLLKSHRDDSTPITLGEYIDLGVGVCREHALLMHLALRTLGLNPRFIYAQTVPMFARSFTGTVDHAFNVIRFEGDVFVIDSYTPRYNGLSLRDFGRGMILQPLNFAPWRDTGGLFLPAKIFKINDFPKITKKHVSACEQVFQ